jgi:hypothetical protein
MRNFDTGATRDSDEGKNDYEAIMHPLCIEAYGDYMTAHMKQADGKMREGDNWQKGFGENHLNVCIKSCFRHFMDLWKIHRGIKVLDKKDGHEVNAIEACCAILFNINAYLLWVIQANERKL